MIPLIVGYSDIERCKIHSLSAGHYRRIGDYVTCECFDAADAMLHVYHTPPGQNISDCFECSAMNPDDPCQRHNAEET